MAENKQSFGDGIGRQEEEVRDLFNLLTKKESADQPQKTVETVPEDPEESVLPAVSVTEEPAVEPQELTAENVPIAEQPLSEQTAVAEALAPKPVTPPTPFAARERRVFVVDEDDGLELPPLILTAYDENEEDDADEFDNYDHFILPVDEDEVDYEIDEAPVQRRNPLAVFWRALCGNVPLPCDSKPEIVRKSVFWLSLVVFAGALTYILYNVWWLPSFTKNLYKDLAQEYHPEISGVVENITDGEYPQQMKLSFQTLYDRNKETRGWLSFHASGNQDFLDIEYPIMYSGDNKKYLTVDFNENKNKNGALFFDMRAKLDSAEDSNTSLIVYGHNMASGQMLAGLNKFIGNVNNARVAPTMTMNTLFANGQYKVFAVVITDESAQPQHYFNIRRTVFTDSEDYLTYIEHLRARSLFDYPVDVQVGDELLLLSTCTVPSSAKIDNGRLTVVARKVRAGETSMVNTSAIVKNDDVIMPYAWYTLQNKQPHAYYSGGVIIAPDTTTSTTTTTWTVAPEDTTIEGGSTTLSPFEETTLTDSSSTSVGTTSTTAVTSANTSSTSSSATSAGSTSSTSAGSTSSSESSTESSTESTVSTTAPTHQE